MSFSPLSSEPSERVFGIIRVAAKDRALGALIGLAVGDALGAPVEFQERGTFPQVTEMQSGGYFRLPAGAWTDDTAMALCLADSLIAHRHLDVPDLLNRFVRWLNDNENTSTDRCIGAGQNTLAVLGNYHRTGALIAPPVKGRSDGNGAIMRLAPVACMHFGNTDTLRRIAIRQSQATHCSELSSAASEMLGWLLGLLIDGTEWQSALSAVWHDDWPDEIKAISRQGWASKNADEIQSTGYVVHTLEAAMWAVGTTANFEDALVKAVNLGHDADTVGAVTGQIAGARYGVNAIPGRWRDSLVRGALIAEKAEMLFAKRPLRSMPDFGTVSGLIEISDRMGWCTDWHCGTCAASRLRRGLEKLLGCQTSYPAYPEAAMERLAHMMAGVSGISDGGSAEALLLLVSKKLGFEQTSAILGDSPAGSHYHLMWRAHLVADEKRELHRQRFAPERVAAQRAEKAKARADAHESRIEKYKALRPSSV